MARFGWSTQLIYFESQDVARGISLYLNGSGCFVVEHLHYYCQLRAMVAALVGWSGHGWCFHAAWGDHADWRKNRRSICMVFHWYLDIINVIIRNLSNRKLCSRIRRCLSRCSYRRKWRLQYRHIRGFLLSVGEASGSAVEISSISNIQ